MGVNLAELSEEPRALALPRAHLVPPLVQLRFRLLPGLGFRVSVFRFFSFQVPGFGFRVPGFDVSGSGFEDIGIPKFGFLGVVVAAVSASSTARSCAAYSRSYADSHVSRLVLNQPPTPSL